MTDITAEPASAVSPADVVRKPILISVAQVLFSTAAALASRRPKPKPRRHYPARYAFLEHAAMAREMYRL